MKASLYRKVFVTHQGKETQARLEDTDSAEHTALSPLSAGLAERLPRKSPAYQTTLIQ